MTRDEIIDGLERHTVGRIKKERVFITVEELQQYIDAIKALEQEPVLNKIRAEIEQEQDDFMDDDDYDEGVRFGLMLAYQIIDKYKAESEE